MFFDERLQKVNAQSLQYLQDLSNGQNTLITAGFFTVQDIMPFTVSLCLGIGPGDAATNQTSSNNALFGVNAETQQNGIVISPNQSYLIPKTVVSLLLGDSTPQQKSVGPTYVDLLKVFVGIQTFNSYNSPRLDPDGNIQTFSSVDFKGFIPKIKEKKARIYSTEKPLTGTFPIGALNFNQASVWSILNGYLNSPINEMYTCLRLDEEGFVVPTLVVRQLPFSTPSFVKNNVGTNYLDLPRWYIDNNLVIRINRGKSNATRYNYMCLSPGIFPGYNSNINPQLVYQYAKPIADFADIKRSGLRSMIATVASPFDPADPTGSGSYWNKMMSDILFGSHLKATGTAILKGIQEPICEGDNCVINNVIYHIERVMHSGSIDESGRKDFSTALHLTNGLDIFSDDANDIVYIQDHGDVDKRMGTTFERSDK